MSADSMKRIDLDCGIPYRRLAAWLDEDLGLEQSDNAWTFSDGAACCTITLCELEKRSFNHVEFERTQLVAEGEPQTLEAFCHLFTLRFLSAGG